MIAPPVRAHRDYADAPPLHRILPQQNWIVPLVIAGGVVTLFAVGWLVAAWVGVCAVAAFAAGWFARGWVGRAG